MPANWLDGVIGVIPCAVAAPSGHSGSLGRLRIATADGILTIWAGDINHVRPLRDTRAG